MNESVVDLTPHDLAFEGRPILLADQRLHRAFGSDTPELASHLEELFLPGGRWCRVGADIYSLGHGDSEVRLRPIRRGWGADLFPSGWGTAEEFELVPEKYRAAVAAYVDVRDRVQANLTTVAELRVCHAAAGDAAIDALVVRLLAMVEDRLRALDVLRAALTLAARQEPWSRQLLTVEVHGAAVGREWTTSAFLEFRLGTAGMRPETIGAWGFDLPSGFISLTCDCRYTGD